MAAPVKCTLIFLSLLLLCQELLACTVSSFSFGLLPHFQKTSKGYGNIIQTKKCSV